MIPESVRNVGVSGLPICSRMSGGPSGRVAANTGLSNRKFWIPPAPEPLFRRLGMAFTGFGGTRSAPHPPRAYPCAGALLKPNTGPLWRLFFRPFNHLPEAYKLDLRSGWMRFMDIARPTARGNEHEITTIKRQDKEDLRCGAPKGRSTLMVYDAAIIDFHYAYNLKQSKGVYILTGWKDNLAPMSAIPRQIDRTLPANALVISDETLYFNNTPGSWRRITASCPDSEEVYVTLTNQMTLSPGALNQCRRLRWNIEKAFDQQEQKLDERKAWSTSEQGKRIQAIAMGIVHNLLRLFEAKLKHEEGIQDSKVINAWQKSLAKRAEKAREAGRELPLKLYQALYRPTEVSLQFIRWLRVGLNRPTCYRLVIEQLRPLMRAYL